MGERLDRLDRVLDVNAIVLDRVVETVAAIMSPHVPKSLEGEDRVAADNPGFYTLVAEVFKVVKAEAHDVLSEAPDLILEYQQEKEQVRQRALEERGIATALPGDVA